MAAAEWFHHRSGVLTREECDRWVRAVYAARADWTPCFEGVQFTLGRAYYTHLEEDRAGEYFATARASDALVERALPDLQARVRTILADVVAAPVAPRPGFCGPGVHIFPAGEWLSENGGDIHFDTEGLTRRAARSSLAGPERHRHAATAPGGRRVARLGRPLGDRRR